MAIASHTDETEFANLLDEQLSPSTPITSEAHLKGRSSALKDIRRGLAVSGRHAFIHGERGVGKSSLALTVAFQIQSSDAQPVEVSCISRSTFFGTIEDIVSKLISKNPLKDKEKTSIGIQGNLPFIKATAKKTIEQGEVPTISSMNDAVELIRYAGELHSSNPVVVIDEFDKLSDDSERELFADFIKQMGDQRINIKLIFCGIGSSITDLLQTHHSCFRYISAVALDPVDYTARMEIMTTAASEIGIEIDRDTQIRIASISDGFPHYVHLISNKLFWEIFEDKNIVTKTSVEHYKSSIEKSVKDIEPQLRESYEKATQKYKDDYEEVLWGVADHHEYKRRSTACYDSYVSVMKHRKHREVLTRTQFNNRMSRLKTPAAANILKGTRTGWYEFSEPIMRGYVRLRAENNGVVLAVDHPRAKRLVR